MIPDILLTPTSCLLGPAGSGKSTLARHWVDTYPGVVLAATTGIAAVNMGEGTTINALLRYYDTASLIEAYTSGYLGSTLGKLWRAGVRRIVVDEVSMLAAEQLTILTHALESLAGKKFTVDADLADEMQAGMEAEGMELPIALTLVGDFLQLAPVKAEYAFESPVWEQYATRTHTLSTIHRQSDAGFLAALYAARIGDGGAVAEYFGPRMERVVDPKFDGTTIYATNDAVSRFNQIRMDRLKTPGVVFPAERWGDQRSDWKLVPDQLTLKDGALVMILANRREPPTEEGMPGRLIYANGDLGTITRMDPTHGTVWVRLKRTGMEVSVEWVERTNLAPLDAARRKVLKAEQKEHLIVDRFEQIGSVYYLPLRVAYASTVHKTQSLTLDEVQVNTTEGMFKQPGLTYVALSRARTAEGLRLIGTPEGIRARCVVSQKVREYL